MECENVVLSRYLHAGVRFLLGEIAGKAQIRYPHVAVLVQENIRRLQISVNDVPAVHVLQSQYHLCRVELHLPFVEHPVLAKVIMKIAAVHQVQNETEFVRRLERVRHAHYERTIHLKRNVVT